jgi:serine/threonine protein kinase/Tfp pilus assembly protein PilF
MTAPNQREEAIVNGALQLPLAQRASYLASACAGDAVLRERVEELLEEREKVAAAPPITPPTTEPRQTIVLNFPLAEKPGDRLGHYKLLQQIGEGGCGVVYMADQEEPVRRRVALKIIKLGMDTRNVIARFEAERQALAMMDHPNIAKVLDVGATDSGRPFFVMELVRGIKITEYCDQNNLSTRERLGLFIQVCHAIQHAHQKGVVHRDIKPSNILVTLHDGVPVPKVIDFGIAKATDQRLTDKTLFTQFEQFIGTPAYMSPEQAEMSGLDIDTRSDIYSLGVLLYELLTGKTPFDSKELLQSGVDQMRRTIREREPERPSTRISTMLDADRTQTAKHQKLDSIKLIHVLRGDLDWIVMKALEKDRTRRYETASGLGADVRRYLSNEPVLARPPSNLYRFQKFVRRNKTVFAAVSAGLAALIAGLALSLYLFFQEREAHQAAIKAEREKSLLLKRAEEAAALERQMRQHAELGAKYTQAGMLLNNGNYEEAEKIMSAASNNVSSASVIFSVLGRVHGHRGQWQAALTNYAKVMDLLPEDHFAYFVLAPLFLQIGDVDGYRHHRSRILRQFADTSDPQTGERMTKACLLLPPSATELAAVRKWADVAVAAGPGNPAWAYFQFAKGFAEYRSGHFEEAARWLKQAVEHDQGPDLTVEDYTVLAMAQYQLKQADDAHANLVKATKIAESNLPRADGHDFGDFWHDWIIEQVLMREAQTLIPK